MEFLVWSKESPDSNSFIIHISKIVQLIKKEPAFWIFNNQRIPDKFFWQDAYFAVSVSESQVESVIKYIENQEIYHTKITFEKEASEFMRKFKWKVKFI